MYSARRAKLAGDFCDLSAAVEPQTGSFPQHVSQMRPPLPEASLVSQPVGPAVHRASYKTLLLLFPPWELVIATLKTHFPLLLSMWIPPDRKQEGERNNNCISYDREMNNFNCVCACSVCKCVCKCVLWGIVCVFALWHCGAIGRCDTQGEHTDWSIDLVSSRKGEWEKPRPKWRNWGSDSAAKKVAIKIYQLRELSTQLCIYNFRNPWRHLVWFHTDTYREGNIEKMLDRVRDINFQLFVNQPTSDYRTLLKCDWGPGLFSILHIITNSNTKSLNGKPLIKQTLNNIMINGQAIP